MVSDQIRPWAWKPDQWQDLFQVVPWSAYGLPLSWSLSVTVCVRVAYADKGYTGAPNREFPALNNIKDGIMRKDNINAKLTDFEIQRNKAISKYRYIVEQYFGISHKYDNGDRARVPQLMKNIIDIMFRQFAFNLKKGAKILEIIPV